MKKVFFLVAAASALMLSACATDGWHGDRHDRHHDRGDHHDRHGGGRY